MIYLRVLRCCSRSGRRNEVPVLLFRLDRSFNEADEIASSHYAPTWSFTHSSLFARVCILPPSPYWRLLIGCWRVTSHKWDNDPKANVIGEMWLPDSFRLYGKLLTGNEYYPRWRMLWKRLANAAWRWWWGWIRQSRNWCCSSGRPTQRRPPPLRATSPSRRFSQLQRCWKKTKWWWRWRQGRWPRLHPNCRCRPVATGNLWWCLRHCLQRRSLHSPCKLLYIYDKQNNNNKKGISYFRTTQTNRPALSIYVYTWHRTQWKVQFKQKQNVTKRNNCQSELFGRNRPRHPSWLISLPE